MIIPPHWFSEPITIETYAGQGAYEDQYAAPIVVLGHISGGRRVRASSTGDEVVSSQRIMLPNPTRLADGSGTVDPVAVLTAESRVATAAVSTTVAAVEPHVQPGSGRVVYVSGELV